MSSKNIGLLVEKAKNGNKEAFGELYELYSREMYAFAFWYLGDKYFAEDAVSDAFVSAFVSVGNVKNPKKFKSWLFTILLRCCKKQLSGIIRMRQTDELGEIAEEAETSFLEERAELKTALLSLSEKEREIYLMSSLGNLTSKEIGEIFSMPSGTVRSKISRAGDKLYDILKEGSNRNEKGRKI